jgi:hypothetical protein
MTTLFTRSTSVAYLLAVILVCYAGIDAQPPTAANSPISTETTLPSAELLEPAELVQMLQASGSDHPLVLQVGSHILYAEAHIPGSEYAGAGGGEAGLLSLRERVKTLKKDQFLVIYCGCCPWDRCPNIRPAYQQLHALGFSRVKVLHVADNFGSDWVKKGFPVASGR